MHCLLTTDGFAITDGVHESRGVGAAITSPSPALVWRSRYDGLVSVAQIGDKAVAGISGPWSGKFALTWWERPLPQRQLELFDSMAEAKREVEHWARRMHVGGYSAAPAQRVPHLRMVQTTPAMAAEVHTGLLDRMFALLPRFGRAKLQRTSKETIEQLRRMHMRCVTDIGDLHFSADE